TNPLPPSPCVVLSQSMSLWPSPLKSPVPATIKGLAAEPGEPPPITELPSNNQSTTCPLVVLYQSTSPNPSPLKSRVPVTIKGLAAAPGAPPPTLLAPQSSLATSPLLVLRHGM